MAPLARVLAAAIALAVLLCGAEAMAASSYDQALIAAANQIDRAARTGRSVPAIVIPPAPLPGPPQYSPSVEDWLRTALKTANSHRSKVFHAEDLHAIAATLRYLAAADGATSTGPAIRTDLTAAAKQVLANPAYRQPKTKPAPPPSESLLERIFAWLGDQIDKLFSGLERATSGAPIIGDALAFVLIAGAVIGLAFVAYRVTMGFISRRRPHVQDGVPLEFHAGADELSTAALEAARKGDFARAIALLFGAALMLLDRAEKIQYDPALTPGEYRRLVRRKAAAVASPFDSLARSFTMAAYAEVHMSESEWMDARSSYDTLEPVLARR